MVMIFDEPGLEDLALPVPCFEIEGSGLRFAAFTILSIEAVGAAELDGVGSWETTVGKSDCATVDRLEELAPFNWNATATQCAEELAVC